MKKMILLFAAMVCSGTILTSCTSADVTQNNTETEQANADDTEKQEVKKAEPAEKATPAEQAQKATPPEQAQKAAPAEKAVPVEKTETEKAEQAQKADQTTGATKATSAQKAEQSQGAKEAQKANEADVSEGAQPAQEAQSATQAEPAKDAKQIASGYIGQSASSLQGALGSPSSTDYSPSCLGDGEDGEWKYNGFTVYTYRENGSETVTDVQ